MYYNIFINFVLLDQTTSRFLNKIDIDYLVLNNLNKSRFLYFLAIPITYSVFKMLRKFFSAIYKLTFLFIANEEKDNMS